MGNVIGLAQYIGPSQRTSFANANVRQSARLPGILTQFGCQPEDMGNSAIALFRWSYQKAALFFFT